MSYCNQPRMIEGLVRKRLKNDDGLPAGLLVCERLGGGDRMFHPLPPSFTKKGVSMFSTGSTAIRKFDPRAILLNN